MNAPLARIVRLLQPAWTQLNEFVLGIRTLPSPETNPDRSRWKGAATHRSKHKDNHVYATPDYWYLRKVISILNPSPTDVVYDLGCGSGRFLCTVARKSVFSCIGVELFEPLCREAEKNALKLRGKKVQIKIICSDVVLTDLSEGTIYFMFNPFGRETMSDVLSNLNRSLIRNPRPITIVYYNSHHEDLFSSCGWLEEFRFFHTRAGMKVGFWRNRPLSTSSL